MAYIKVQTHRLKKGMVIKEDVYTRSGVVIVPEGTVVTKEVYNLLTRHFVDDVIVDYTSQENTGELSDIKSADPVAVKLKEFSKSFQIAEELLAKNLTELVQKDEEIDIRTLLDMLQEIVNKADSDSELLELLNNMERSSESLYAHSINVSLYAQLLARWVQLSKDEMEFVSVAGLLHDIGHLKYPDGVWEGFSFHDELEKQCHEKHSVYGYKIIQNKSLDYCIKQAVLAHHERMDGKGFPMGVPFTNLNSVTRILAIADTYVTLTTEEPGHPALVPFEALKGLQMQEFRKFDSKYLLTFIERVAQTFIRHEVLLSNGKKGKILMLNKSDLTRPLVQVNDYFIDLAINKGISIKKILN